MAPVAAHLSPRVGIRRGGDRGLRRGRRHGGRGASPLLRRRPALAARVRAQPEQARAPLEVSVAQIQLAIALRGEPDFLSRETTLVLAVEPFRL